MAEKEVRKTTAKKTVRRTASKTIPARTSVRKTAAPSARKAPSRVVVERSKGGSPKIFFGGLLFFVVLLGISAAIGFSGSGQLDVESSIAQRKQNASPEEQEIMKSVPVQQTQTAAPNGGLVGMGDSEIPPPPPPVVETASSTASSTEATASSTEPIAEEQTEEPPVEEVVTEEVEAVAEEPAPI